MRLATIHGDEDLQAALVEGVRVLPLAGSGIGSVREIAAGGAEALDQVATRAYDPGNFSGWRSLEEVTLGPADRGPGRDLPRSA